MTQTGDGELARSAAAGDGDAFAELVRSHELAPQDPLSMSESERGALLDTLLTQPRDVELLKQASPGTR